MTPFTAFLLVVLAALLVGAGLFYVIRAAVRSGVRQAEREQARSEQQHR